MNEDPANPRCLNCGTSDSEMPLISVRFSGRPLWVCSKCMPVLIHETDQIKTKLETGDAR
jgi:hypothetical protein